MISTDGSGIYMFSWLLVFLSRRIAFSTGRFFPSLSSCFRFFSSGWFRIFRSLDFLYLRLLVLLSSCLQVLQPLFVFIFAKTPAFLFPLLSLLVSLLSSLLVILCFTILFFLTSWLYAPTETTPASHKLSVLWALHRLLIEGCPLGINAWIRVLCGKDNGAVSAVAENTPSLDWWSQALSTRLTGDLVPSSCFLTFKSLCLLIF